jgi:hypothetical protein
MVRVRQQRRVITARALIFVNVGSSESRWHSTLRGAYCACAARPRCNGPVWIVFERARLQPTHSCDLKTPRDVALRRCLSSQMFQRRLWNPPLRGIDNDHRHCGFNVGLVCGRFVNIQSDVVHVVSEEPPRLFSESASPLSSASCNTSCSSLTQHSNNTEVSPGNVRRIGKQVRGTAAQPGSAAARPVLPRRV